VKRPKGVTNTSKKKTYRSPMRCDCFFVPKYSIKTFGFISLLSTKKPAHLSEPVFFFDAVWTGLEPATPCVTGRYSNQLNYQTLAL
jgi:hypothetical protein